MTSAKPDNNGLSTAKDHFSQTNGIEFAGTHLLIDLWGVQHIDNICHIENAMRECVDVCDATLLHIHLHHFTPSGGVSGVAVLAESHISVHTWPERNYAAFDVFMCGDAKPDKAVDVLGKYFSPRRVEVRKTLRGKIKDTPNNSLFARFLRWMSFCDPHVLPIHCGSRNSSALNSDENSNY